MKNLEKHVGMTFLSVLFLVLQLGQCNSISLLSYPKLQVPFLSPLEGNIYLQLDSESHSSVQHQGFLVSHLAYLAKCCR